MSSFFVRLGAFNGLVLLVCVLMYAGVLNFPLVWFYEQGPIEISSVSVLLLGSIMMFLHPFAATRAKYTFGWLLAIMGLRELDMDQVLTADSVFKIKFYASAAPMHEKVLGVLMIIGTVWVIWRALSYLPTLFRGIVKGDHISWLVGFGIGYVVMGRFLDTMHRVAPWVADHLLIENETNIKLEEGFEHLGYAMMLFAIIYSYRTMTQEALRQAKAPAPVKVKAAKVKPKKKTAKRK